MACRLINIKFENLSGGAVGHYDLVDSQNRLVFSNIDTQELAAGMTFSVDNDEIEFRLTNFRLSTTESSCPTTTTSTTTSTTTAPDSTLVAQINKNFTTETQEFTISELESLGAIENDLVIVVYYGNSGVSGDFGEPTLDDGGYQDWQTQGADFLDVGGRIALRMWYTSFNGSWDNDILFNNAPTADAQGAGILVYRMDNSFSTIVLGSVPNPSSGGPNPITTRNGFTTGEGMQVTLSKYNAANSESNAYLFIIFACGGSTVSTTPISLNVTTNNGWIQDAQWTHANSGYSIVRVYSIPSENNFEPGSNMPSFVFNRTNGGGHGIVGLVFNKWYE
jgi:hypothetical protein